jgi:uncharacterized protein (UPF0332 family)
MNDKSHSGKIFVFGLSYSEAFDVKTTRSKHARDVGKHAGLILN